jgi:hypothetical protein
MRNYEDFIEDDPLDECGLLKDGHKIRVGMMMRRLRFALDNSDLRSRGRTSASPRAEFDYDIRRWSTLEV